VIKPHVSLPRRHHVKRGMSLAEVMVSMLILTMLCMGLLAGLLQSRRLTDGSVCQNSAQAAVQSYIEQLKNMSAATLCNNTASGVPTSTSYSIPTEINDSTADALYTSTGAPPDISTLTPGVSEPSGVVDNLKDIAADPTRRGAQTSWSTIWPNASTTNVAAQSATPYYNDLHLGYRSHSILRCVGEMLRHHVNLHVGVLGWL
jgi:Tfp pilus assembly protein PilV